MRRRIVTFALALLGMLLFAPAAHAHLTTVVQNGAMLAFAPSGPLAGQPTTISIGLTDASGKPFTDLDVVHERKLHVFIVGSDLQTFAHMHPEDFTDGFAHQVNGTYIVHYTFPNAGVYALLADYTVDGVNTIAELGITVSGASSLPDPVYDFNMTKQFDDYAVTLTTPPKIESGVETELDYHIERGGMNVSDLGLYLDSEMHLVAIRDDLAYPGHTHAYIPGHTLHVGEMPQHYIGPNIPVRYTFAEPGTYALFGQFIENGTLTTTQFMIAVVPPNNQTFAQYENAKRTATFFAQSYELLIVGGGILIVFPLLVWLEKRKKK